MLRKDTRVKFLGESFKLAMSWGSVFLGRVVVVILLNGLSVQ